MERLAGKIILLSGFRRALLAFLAGAFGVLALPPVDFYPAMFVAFPVLVWLLDGASGNPDAGLLRRLWPAFATGWCFGFGYFTAGLWWLANALLIEAAVFFWLIPLAVFGLPALLAIFYGLGTALARLFWSDGFGRLAALAAGLGLAEWLRSFALTGFPWNAIGYAAMPVPVMMQSAALIGIFGVTILSIFVLSAPALLGTKRGRAAGLTIAAILFAAHLGFGAGRLASAPAASAEDSGPLLRIVQPSIDQTEKWDDAARARIFETYLDMTAAQSEAGAAPSVVIWPETAVPFILTQSPAALQRIGEVLQESQTLVTGAVRAEAMGGGEIRYTNSIVVIDDQGQIVTAADKLHLVPFGEYLPFEDLLTSLGLRMVAEAPGGFSAGAERPVITLPGGARFLPLICYEAIFPGEIALGERNVDFLLNVTNDGWYGDSPGPYQHFRQAQIRAVENGVPLVRAANNGISAVVDAYGRVVDGLALNAVGVLDARLPPTRPPTPFRQDSATYFWLIFGAMLLIAIVSRGHFRLGTD